MRRTIFLCLPTTILTLSVAFGPPSPAMADDSRSVVMKGILSVFQEDDFRADRTRRVHLLENSETGRVYELRFVGGIAPDLSTGQTVTIRGTSRTDAITIDLRAADVLSIGPAPTSDGRSVSGVRSTLVIVVDFQNSAVACTDATIADKMFTGTQSVDGLYQETSFGAVSFPRDTNGDTAPDVVRVAIGAQTTDACDPYTWADAADLDALGAGYVPSAYQHKVYVLPQNVSCTWAGLGNVGCPGSCRIWTRYCSLQDVYAHELGHNLGMSHASTDPNNDGVVDCEYCDNSDFMSSGGIGWRQINGPHKVEMGWLPTEQVTDVTPGAPTSHVISPLETSPLTAVYPQAIRIAHPITGDFYFLSLRRRTGYDATLSSSYADKTSVHVSKADGTGRSRFVGALADGQTFDDGVGLRVTQISHDSLSATLLIEDASQACNDQDGDGYGAPGRATCANGAATDCDDADPAVHPGATELCDGADNDCDGTTDVGAADAAIWYPDLDQDGYGDSAAAVAACSPPAGCIGSGGDCADGDASIPGPVEICRNLADDDCNGLADAEDSACSAPACLRIALGGTAGADPLLHLGGACGEAGTLSRPVDVVWGDLAAVRGSGGTILVGAVTPIACGETARERMVDNQRPGPHGVDFFLARESGATDYGTSSTGQPREPDQGDCP